MTEDKHITPYVPPAAKADVRQHLLRGKPVFMRPIAQREWTVCKNCSGAKYVFISFVEAGPFPTPPGGRKPATWFDGGPGLGKGWYIVKTVGYACPECTVQEKPEAPPLPDLPDVAHTYMPHADD